MTQETSNNIDQVDRTTLLAESCKNGRVTGLVKSALDVNEGSGRGNAFGEAVLNKGDQLMSCRLSRLRFSIAMLIIVEPVVGFSEPGQSR